MCCVPITNPETATDHPPRQNETNHIHSCSVYSPQYKHLRAHPPPGRIGIGWNNETPLHRAARLGRNECVATLLRLGANFRARNERGESAFDVAGMYNDRVQVALGLGSRVGV